jgi:DNA polymerase V
MPSGGKRVNAGRPSGQGPYGEKTKTIRVPESAVTDIKTYLELRQQRVSLSLVPLAKMTNPIADVARVDAANDKILLPLVGPRVAAGFPSPADDYMEDYLDLNQLLISEKESTYLVRVKGESMINIGIFPKDLLIVDRSRDPIDGDIIIAVLDGELTVKRLEKRGHRVALVAENKKFPPIVVREDQEFLVWGIVTHCIHSY